MVPSVSAMERFYFIVVSKESKISWTFTSHRAFFVRIEILQEKQGKNYILKGPSIKLIEQTPEGGFAKFGQTWIWAGGGVLKLFRCPQMKK